MTEKQRAAAAVELLEKEYPDAVCQLRHEQPHELLIAVRLSAQCTDARVNMVTPALFERFRSVEDFAAAEADEVAEYIHSCGLYKTKAKDIVAMCRMLRDDYGGAVPDSVDELLKLPGVGRKTANLICGDIFGKPTVVTDTHFIRIMNLMGFVKTTDPYKVEMKMRSLLDPQKSNDFCHRIVLHGRAVCVARRPKCGECVLAGICKSAGK